MKKQIDSKLALKTIDLKNTNAWDSDLKYISRDGVSNIEQVLLWNNRITWKGMQLISLCKWDSLKLIDIDRNHVGNIGAKYLSRLKSSALKEFNLCTNEIGKEGVLHISKGDWPKLETIFLNGNKLGVNSIKYLNKNHWRNIRKVHLYATCITLLEAYELILSHWSLLSVDIDKNMMTNKQQTLLKNTLNRKYEFRI